MVLWFRREKQRSGVKKKERPLLRPQYSASEVSRHGTPPPRRLRKVLQVRAHEGDDWWR